MGRVLAGGGQWIAVHVSGGYAWEKKVIFVTSIRPQKLPSGRQHGWEFWSLDTERKKIALHEGIVDYRLMNLRAEMIQSGAIKVAGKQLWNALVQLSGAPPYDPTTNLSKMVSG